MTKWHRPRGGSKLAINMSNQSELWPDIFGLVSSDGTIMYMNLISKGIKNIYCPKLMQFEM